MQSPESNESVNDGKTAERARGLVTQIQGVLAESAKRSPMQSVTWAPSRTQAEHAAIVVLRALIPHLPQTNATASVRGLLQTLVEGQAHDAQSLSPEAALERDLGVSAEHAAELARAIVVALLEALGDQAAPLIAELPASLRPPGFPTDGASELPSAGLGRSLAEGRPGSHRSFARKVHPGRAHAESIAQADEPYADSRLASARGMSSERSGRSLATGGTPNERALAGSPANGPKGRAEPSREALAGSPANGPKGRAGPSREALAGTKEIARRAPEDGPDQKA